MIEEYSDSDRAKRLCEDAAEEYEYDGMWEDLAYREVPSRSSASTQDRAILGIAYMLEEECSDRAESYTEWMDTYINGPELPDGYPQTVSVEDLPDQVQSYYESASYEQAVEVAPGVWTPLAPGASVDDAINTMSFDGFCASKQAFEREYLDGLETAGSCW